MIGRLRDIGGWIAAYAWATLFILAMVGAGLLDVVTSWAPVDRFRWRALGWFLRQSKR